MDSSIVAASPRTKALLTRLHAENSLQEASWQRVWYQIGFTLHCLRNWPDRESWNEYNSLHCTHQLLSHSRDKCELMYMLATLNRSKSIVECGTSFGVSTIYFALAAQRNVHGRKSEGSGVITIEKDAAKVNKAKTIWAEAGQEIGELITPHEGDLLDVLGKDGVLPPVVDLVFLDAWTSLALPCLKLILPRLREGSLVFADKTGVGNFLYQDLLEFVHDPANGFMSMTLPLKEGFEVMVRTSCAVESEKDN